MTTCPTCKTGLIVDGACEDCGRALPGSSLIDGADAAPAPVTSPVQPTNRATRATTRSSIVVSLAGGSTKASARVQTTRGSSSRRRALGGGLVSLPPMPSNKPLDLLMADPVVPPNKRICQGLIQNPGDPTGDKITCFEVNPDDAKDVSKPTVLKREKGFCPRCGTAYNFVPSLKKDDLVSNQYRIHGPIAYGGLGWIYLGFDEILQRWVVLKGLLNSKDEIAAATALAERQFLAAVKHPKIVGVYNFVQHGSEGFIVMEYVGGKTLRAIRKERGPLPAAEAISFILGVLPAFAYLHDQGLVYCDFKPDNLMFEETDVKLIDMGAVRKVDDSDGVIYATAGYEPPEMSQNPTPLSDLYTLGRALANLTMDFSMVTRHPFDLPPIEEQPVLGNYESLRLFLERACAKDPALRFQSADEMAEQLFGVLREVVAIDSNAAKPGGSSRFLGDGLLEAHEEAFFHPTDFSMPRLSPDADDKALPDLINVSSLKGEVLVQRIGAIRERHPKSREAAYALVQALVAGRDYEGAHKLCAELLDKDPYDWRAWYLDGRAYFAEGQYREAGTNFARVRAELPGELGAQLALALALEALGEVSAAATLHERVSLVDPSFVSSAFGLARCYLANQNRDGAVEALGRVPAGHALFESAGMMIVAVLTGKLPDRPEFRHLEQAAERLRDLAHDQQITQLLTAQLMIEAAEQAEAKKAPQNGTSLLGVSIASRQLRLSAEKALREAARLAPSPESRKHLVDRANTIRPLTWI